MDFGGRWWEEGGPVCALGCGAETDHSYSDECHCCAIALVERSSFDEYVIECFEDVLMEMRLRKRDRGRGIIG